jgi:3-deoxy-D-manno-octulosonic-acid transferase
MKIAFLYNHEAGHQVRHSAVVIPALLARYPNIDVTVLATSDALLNTVRSVAGDVRCKFVRLDTPAWHKPFARLLDAATGALLGTIAAR